MHVLPPWSAVGLTHMSDATAAGIFCSTRLGLSIRRPYKAVERMVASDIFSQNRKWSVPPLDPLRRVRMYQSAGA